MEIHFRLVRQDDGSLRIYSRFGDEGPWWTHGWSLLDTVPNEHEASLACGDEVLYQLDNEQLDSEQEVEEP